MRKLLFILVIFPSWGIGQKLDRNEFDKIDSAYVVSTKPDDLATKWSTAISTWVIYIHNVKEKFKALGDTRQTRIFFSINPSSVTSIDESSSVKIRFTDEFVREYKNESKNQIISPGNSGQLSILVLPNDRIFKSPIKTVRISTSDTYFDFEVRPKNSDRLIKHLALVFSKED